MIDLRLGNCLDVMRSMSDNSVDAIVTDPPYGLSFMGKKWDYDVPSQEIWEEARHREREMCWHEVTVREHEK